MPQSGGFSPLLDRHTSIGILVLMNDEELKPVRWIGSSKKDLKTFPKTVQRDVGQALYASQLGAEYSTVKALKGFGGRSVLEIVGGRYNSYVSRSVHGSVCRCDLRASRISEEIKEGHFYAPQRNGTGPPAACNG